MSQTELNAATEPGAGSAAAGLPAYVPVGRVPWREWPGAGVLLRLAASTPLAALFLVGMVACTTVIVLDGAAAMSPLVPPQPAIAGYLNGIGSKLDYTTFLTAFLAMSGCYAGAVWCSRALSTRAAVAAIVVLHAIVFAGPILNSQDIFQYVAYARLGAIHHINPYLHGPGAAHHDPIYPYVGERWRFVASAYGPLALALSYPLAFLGVDGALWGFKALGTASSLATIWLVWLCARRLGRDPLPAVMIVGLNPLMLMYGLGGFHNDLLMNALIMAGVLMVLGGRDARGAVAVVLAGAVKAVAVVVLPFALLARRRITLVYGALIGLGAMALLAYLMFGVHGLDFVSVLNRNAKSVSTDSFPNEIAHTFGYPGVFPVDRTLWRLASALVLVWLLWRTWRGYDWIAASAWALLLLAVTTTWLLPWYLLWALPLSVLTRDRRVLWATMFVIALFIVHQTAPLFSPTA